MLGNWEEFVLWYPQAREAEGRSNGIHYDYEPIKDGDTVLLATHDFVAILANGGGPYAIIWAFVRVKEGS